MSGQGASAVSRLGFGGRNPSLWFANNLEEGVSEKLPFFSDNPTQLVFRLVLFALGGKSS